LVNQARQNPLEMAESLGLDKQQVLLDFASWYDVLTNGLPPLSFNATLASAARGHATDMLDNGYYSSESLDGRTYEDRIREAGYDEPEVGESTGFWRLCSCDPQEATEELFGYMFKAELSGDCNPAQWNILSSVFTEVGIGVVTGESPELGGLCGDNIELLVADFGVLQEVEDSVNP